MSPLPRWPADSGLWPSQSSLPACWVGESELAGARQARNPCCLICPVDLCSLPPAAFSGKMKPPLFLNHRSELRKTPTGTTRNLNEEGSWGGRGGPVVDNCKQGICNSVPVTCCHLGVRTYIARMSSVAKEAGNLNIYVQSDF